MTPTQAAADKAKELIEKFLDHVKSERPPKANGYYHAKQCAIIHVNEILETFSWMRPSETLEFYDQVKTHLQSGI